MIRNALNLLRLTLTAMVALIMVSAAAQGFPERPIKILVPYSAGSTTDIMARLIATSLAERTKQTVVVENRVGAGGIVGLKALQASPADGYTIGLVVSGNAVQPWLMKDMPFDVRKDFTPLSLMYVGQYLLMVPPELPPQNLAEFLAYLKSNPKKVFFGSSGAGTTTHLAGELLKQMGGVEMTHVPFKGSPEVFNAMFSGSVQAYFDLYGTAKPLIDAGKVRPLATSGKTRMASLPNLPALAEALPGFEVLVWTGFAVPNGTPPNVVAKLTTELRAVMQAPEVRKRLADMGVEPGGGTSAAMAIFVAAESEKWGKTIQAAGIKPD